MRIDQYDQIREIFEAHHGIIRTSDLLSHGIHNTWLNKLMVRGVVSKIRRGVYEWVENGMKENAEIIHHLFPDAILCMYSALSVYGYTDRTPDIWHLAFDRNMNKHRLKINYPNVKPYYMKPHILSIGITTESISGIALNIYDRDRTICDVLRFSSKMDREILNKAIQAYLTDEKKNFVNLFQYGKALRVSTKVQQWIGVWL